MRFIKKVLKKLFLQKSFFEISEILKKTMVSARGHALRRVLMSVLAKAGPN
jgi:hypothetical protein